MITKPSGIFKFRDTGKLIRPEDEMKLDHYLFATDVDVIMLLMSGARTLYDNNLKVGDTIEIKRNARHQYTFYRDGELLVADADDFRAIKKGAAYSAQEEIDALKKRVTLLENI